MKIENCKVGMKVEYVDDDWFGKMHCIVGDKFTITEIWDSSETCRLDNNYTVYSEHLEPVEKFEVGEEVIYEDFVGKHKAKIFGIADKEDCNGEKYAITYKAFDKIYNALASKNNLEKLKQKDELEKGDKFIDVYGDKIEVLSKEYCKFTEEMQYFCKNERDGFVTTWTSSEISEVIQ